MKGMRPSLRFGLGVAGGMVLVGGGVLGYVAHAPRPAVQLAQRSASLTSPTPTPTATPVPTPAPIPSPSAAPVPSRSAQGSSTPSPTTTPTGNTPTPIPLPVPNYFPSPPVPIHCSAQAVLNWTATIGSGKLASPSWAPAKAGCEVSITATFTCPAGEIRVGNLWLDSPGSNSVSWQVYANAPNGGPLVVSPFRPAASQALRFVPGGNPDPNCVITVAVGQMAS